MSLCSLPVLLSTKSLNVSEMETQKLSPAAEVVFTVADLFGEGGKSFNASFAATILRSLVQSGIDRETMIDGWVCKAIDVETILNVAAELESFSKGN